MIKWKNQKYFGDKKEKIFYMSIRIKVVDSLTKKVCLCHRTPVESTAIAYLQSLI